MRKMIAIGAAAALLAAGLVLLHPAAAAQGAAAQPSGKPANDMHEGGAAMAAAAVPTGTGPMVHRLVNYQLNEAKKKLVSLAEAIPADKYGWRPAPGVRSTGEVFMHVASANYFLPTMWGAGAAAGVDPRTLEKDGADKAKTVAALKASFDYAMGAIEKLPDAELTKTVKFFGREAIAADLVMGLATHAHEHLGQAIAYARSNGITPPWSEDQPPAKKGK